VKTSYSKKNESAVTLRIESSLPPQKFQIVHSRDKLYRLIYEECLLQEASGTKPLSISKIAQALHAAFEIYNPEGRNTPNLLKTTKEQLSQHFVMFSDELKLQKDKK